MPFNSGLPLIDGHRLPQAVACGLPLPSIDAPPMQTVLGGRTFLKAVRFPPPPPPSWESKPTINDRPANSRVLPGPRFPKGRPPPVLASTENSQKTGKPENSGARCSYTKYVILLTMFL